MKTTKTKNAYKQYKYLNNIINLLSIIKIKNNNEHYIVEEIMAYLRHTQNVYKTTFYLVEEKKMSEQLVG